MIMFMVRPEKVEGFVTPILGTVNSNIFARGLFSRNFAYAKFRENKILMIS